MQQVIYFACLSRREVRTDDLLLVSMVRGFSCCMQKEHRLDTEERGLEDAPKGILCWGTPVCLNISACEPHISGMPQQRICVVQGIVKQCAYWRMMDKAERSLLLPAIWLRNGS